MLLAAGPRPNALPHAEWRCGGHPRAREDRLTAPPCACLSPRTLVPQCDIADSVIMPLAQVGAQDPPGPRSNCNCQPPTVGPGL